MRCVLCVEFSAYGYQPTVLTKLLTIVETASSESRVPLGDAVGIDAQQHRPSGPPSRVSAAGGLRPSMHASTPILPYRAHTIIKGTGQSLTALVTRLSASRSSRAFYVVLLLLLCAALWTSSQFLRHSAPEVVPNRNPDS